MQSANLLRKLINHNPEDISPGVISAIEPQKKAKDRFSVYIDGRFAFGIHSDVLLTEGINKGQDLSEVDIRRILEADEVCRARYKAYQLLAYRQRSRAELSYRLKHSGYSVSAVNQVVERLANLDLIDDEAFATEFATARVRSKGYGPGRIRNELRQKGLQPDTINQAVQVAYADQDIHELVSMAASKFAKRLVKESDPRIRKAKLTAHLARKGFSYEQIQAALLDETSFDER